MSILNCNYSNRAADGAHVSFMTNTSIATDPVQLSQVYVTIIVHVSRTCLLCGGMLYNRMEGDEWRVKWGVDRQAVPLHAPQQNYQDTCDDGTKPLCDPD